MIKISGGQHIDTVMVHSIVFFFLLLGLKKNTPKTKVRHNKILEIHVCLLHIDIYIAKIYE